jgi:hypothetical protein
LDPYPLRGGWFSAFFRIVTHQRVNFAGASRTMDSFLDKYPVGSPEWRWLEGYGDMRESSELSSLSEDSLKRNHAEKIVRLGPRRLGMKRRDALSLGKPLKAGKLEARVLAIRRAAAGGQQFSPAQWRTVDHMRERATELQQSSALAMPLVQEVQHV